MSPSHGAVELARRLSQRQEFLALVRIGGYWRTFNRTATLCKSRVACSACLGAVLFMLIFAGLGCGSARAPAHVPEPATSGKPGLSFAATTAKVEVVASAEPKQDAPVPDTDGDTIPDDEDACPNEKGRPDPDRTKKGCPASVRVTETEVIILQQIQFDVSKSAIRASTKPLLEEVAAVLREHPEIVMIEVQGHTNSQGRSDQNKKLSQARADAVKMALRDLGIDGDRLTVRGYGQDKPIGDNKTAEGRQHNDRVQFVILEKKAKGIH